MNRILSRLRAIMAAPRKSVDDGEEKAKKDPDKVADYSDLSNPKNMERYQKELEMLGVNFDDATGKVKQDPIMNRMLQDPAWVKSSVGKWMSDVDAADQPLDIPQDIMQIQVGDQTVKDMADSDDSKVNLDNEKRPRNVVSPYKIIAQLCNQKADILQKAEHAFLQERVTLEERIEYLESSKAINFCAKFFGGGSKKAGESICRQRRQHYRSLSNAWQDGLKEVYDRSAKMATDLYKTFEEVNRKGKELYGSDIFDHVAKKGDAFIANLKTMAQDAAQGKPVNSRTCTGPAFAIYHYLDSSILKGDGDGVVAKRIADRRSAFKRKLVASLKRVASNEENLYDGETFDSPKQAAGKGQELAKKNKEKYVVVKLTDTGKYAAIPDFDLMTFDNVQMLFDIK
jgi:hypothetical protein